jgi:hypothetical protein
MMVARGKDASSLDQERAHALSPLAQPLPSFPLPSTMTATELSLRPRQRSLSPLIPWLFQFGFEFAS